MENNRRDFQEAMRIAQSPAGQELIKLLQSQGGDALKQAMGKAAEGDYSQARETLGTLLQSEEAKKLMKKLER